MSNFSQRNYNARWYDPALGRFAQADSIIPPGVHPHRLGAGGLDRYAYVNNSPMNYVDPTGHVACNEEGVCSGNPSGNKPSQGGLPSGNWGDDEDDDIPSTESGGECNGSGLITQYCLDMDAEAAQELEDLLDNASDFFDIAGWLEFGVGGIGVARDLLPKNLPIAVAKALTALSPPVALAVLILGVEAQILSNELSNISESLSDSHVTTTGGRLTISSNIVFNYYEVSTPSGVVYDSTGFVPIGGIQASQALIQIWATSQRIKEFIK